LRPSVLPTWLPANHCGHHPGVGDYPDLASPSAGLRSTSHRPGPSPPRGIRVRRSPRQRGLIGEVRATAGYFAPSRCEMPFEIALPPAFRKPAAARPPPQQTPETLSYRILSRMSRLRKAAPCLTARRFRRPPPRAGGAAGAARGQWAAAVAEGRDEKVALNFLSSEVGDEGKARVDFDVLLSCSWLGCKAAVLLSHVF
jgi:hypothetical protein